VGSNPTSPIKLNLIMLKFIKETTWAKVFEGWESREASNPGWIRCATEIKGWPDWESWRKFSASQVGAENRAWQIYEFTDPINDIPKMLVGPYKGWQSKLPGKNKQSFEELLNIPENYEFFRKHSAIDSLLKNFPSPTEFIGLIREDGRIVCLEGHHRATAVALAKKENRAIYFKGTIRIALAKLPKEEYLLLNAALERGSSQKPES
jgi:hypothetical protein